MQPLPAASGRRRPGRSFAGNPLANAGRSPFARPHWHWQAGPPDRRFHGLLRFPQERPRARALAGGSKLGVRLGRQKSHRPRGRPGPLSFTSQASRGPGLLVKLDAASAGNGGKLQVAGRPYLPPAAAARYASASGRRRASGARLGNPGGAPLHCHWHLIFLFVLRSRYCGQYTGSAAAVAIAETDDYPREREIYIPQSFGQILVNLKVRSGPVRFITPDAESATMRVTRQFWVPP